MSKTINIEGINLTMTDMNLTLAIDTDGFCGLFKHLYNQTLPKPDSNGTWWVIDDNGKTMFCRIFTTFEGIFASENKTIDLNKGRWVKVI